MTPPKTYIDNERLDRLETKIEDIRNNLVSAELISQFSKVLDAHGKFIDGNGGPGAKSRFTALELYMEDAKKAITKIEESGSSWAGQHVIQLENENVAVRELARQLKEANEKQQASSAWKIFLKDYLKPALLFLFLWGLFQFLPTLVAHIYNVPVIPLK